MTSKSKEKLILDRDSSILREVAKPVGLKEIRSKKIRDVIARMKKALKNEDDGVAIAAPQIGISLRIFVVSAKVLRLAKNAKAEGEKTRVQDMVFINPEIIKVSKKRKHMEEGCLSVRWLYGEVERHEKITITSFDENGKQATYGAGGLMAQIFQHEIDHLDGVLFIDKAENVRDLPPNANEN